MSERDIQRACLDWLTAKGIFAWRQNQIPVPTKDGGFRRFNGMPGLPDILAVIPQTVEIAGNGRHTFGCLAGIEVKRPGGKLSDDQRFFLEEINRRGGIGIVAHSVEELERELAPYLDS